MTYQEVLWKGKQVWVVGILSKSGKLHRYLRKYVGRDGVVLGESKNGMLLVQFGKRTRCIPAGCLALYSEVYTAGKGE
jgi:hypothetical protein